MATKIFDLRLFDADSLQSSDVCIPPGGPRELSASDLGLPVLLVSQFTLYGSTRKGRRPTWEQAAPGPVAKPLVDEVVTELRRLGAVVHEGVFGAHMQVSLTNNGPLTVLVEI